MMLTWRDFQQQATASKRWSVEPSPMVSEQRLFIATPGHGKSTTCICYIAAILGTFYRRVPTGLFKLSRAVGSPFFVYDPKNTAENLTWESFSDLPEPLTPPPDVLAAIRRLLGKKKLGDMPFFRKYDDPGKMARDAYRVPGVLIFEEALTIDPGSFREIRKLAAVRRIDGDYGQIIIATSQQFSHIPVQLRGLSSHIYCGRQADTTAEKHMRTYFGKDSELASELTRGQWLVYSEKETGE